MTRGIDHIALTVPDLDAQVERFASAFGMVVVVDDTVTEVASSLSAAAVRSFIPVLVERQAALRLQQRLIP